jgi:rhodanese-related sulfurtransferase
MEKRKTIGLIFLLGLSFSVFAQSEYDKKLESLYNNTVRTIPSQEAKKLIGNPKVIFIDTRSPEEYQVSHLSGAKFLDYDSYSTDDLKKFPKDCKLIVYCSVGFRSERVGEKLLTLGFTDVVNLYGGIFEWKNENFQVVNRFSQPTDSVHTYNKNWSRWLKKGIKVY